MKKILILSLVGLVLIAGCVEIPALKSLFTTQAVWGATEDIDISAEIPRFVKEGMPFDFNIFAKASNDVKNLRLEIFDKCTLFQNTDGTTEVWPNLEIKSDRPAKVLSPKPKYKVQDKIDFEKKDCSISFRTNYTASFFNRQEVTLLPYADYERKTPEEFSEIQPNSASSTNPLKVTFSTDEEYPFIWMDNDEVIFHIGYKNQGKGLIEKLKAKEVWISLPEKINVESCDDYIIFEKCKKFNVNEENMGYGGNTLDGAVVLITDEKGKRTFKSWGCGGMHDISDHRFIGYTPEGFKIYYREMSNTQIIILLSEDKSCRLTLYESNCDNSISTSLNLKKDLNFNNKKAKTSTCKFSTDEVNTITLGSIEMRGSYEYKITGEIGPIEARKK